MIDFSELSISPATAQLIGSAVEGDRLPHAIILEGGSESDRLTLARRLAQALLCSGEDRPCGACSHCRKVLRGFHPDLTECLAQPGSTESLKVDAIRQLRADAFIFPNEADRRVFLLHNMQLSNEAAQNALLKILEEPPEYVRFLLTCPSATALLPTILSRACTYTLGQQVETRSDETNEAITSLTRQIALSLGAPNEYELMKITGAFEKDYSLMLPVLSQLRLLFRDALIVKNGGRELPLLSAASAEAAALARRFTAPQLLKLAAITVELTAAVNGNANRSLLITRLCSRLSAAAGK